MKKIQVYAMTAGLNYQQELYLIKVKEKPQASDYIVIERTMINDNDYQEYALGSICTIEDHYVFPAYYDLAECELASDFLFQFFIKHYKLEDERD